MAFFISLRVMCSAREQYRLPWLSLGYARELPPPAFHGLVQ